MANITSAATGNFSAGATWTGGVVPGAGDVAIVATGHTVTIDQNVTCTELRKEGSDNSHNGNFVLSTAYTITANITNACTGSSGSALLNFTANSGTTTIVGNLAGGPGSNNKAIIGSGAGTLVVTGNVTGGSASGCAGIDLSGSNTSLTVTGNVTGGAGSASSAYGILMSGTSANLSITGNIVGGSSGSPGIYMSGTSATLTMTGNVTAGTATTAYGVSMGGSSSNAAITGDITASTTSAGVNSSGQLVLDGNFFDAANGRPAFSSALRRVKINTNKRTVYATPEVSNANGSPVVRASLDYVTNNVPVPANVRQGTKYADDQFTGTLAVPSASSVAVGTPVDNTVGTAVLNADVVGALFEAFEA